MLSFVSVSRLPSSQVGSSPLRNLLVIKVPHNIIRIFGFAECAVCLVRADKRSSTAFVVTAVFSRSERESVLIQRKSDKERKSRNEEVAAVEENTRRWYGVSDCFLTQRWSKTASNCGALGRFSFLRKECTTL